MALEIERRFLVSGQQWREVVAWQRDFAQGYLPNSSEAMTSRVRLAGPEEAWLTLKFPAGGIARQEFEYPIPAADASALLECCQAKLIKRRYGLDLPGGDWVLDVFEGENAPLVIAEVELEQADQAVAIPAWCSTEITGLGAFSNAALASHPFGRWSEAEQAPWRKALTELT